LGLDTTLDTLQHRRETMTAMKEPSNPSKSSGRKPLSFLLVGFLAGALFGGFLASGPLSHRSEAPSADPVTDRVVTLEDKATSAAGPAGDAVTRLLESGGTGSLEQTRAVLAFVDSLKPGEFEARLNEAFAKRKGNQGYDLINHLYQKWVSTDPAAALRHAESLTGNDRQTAVGAVLSAWAVKDPYEVLAWVEENGKNLHTQSALFAALRTIAKSDPLEAINLAEGNTNLKTSGHTFIMNGSTISSGLSTAFLYGIWAETDPHAAATRALTIQSAQERRNSLWSLAAQWAATDPRAAWEWGNSLERIGDRDAVLQNVVSAVIGEGDTSQAIAFLEGMAPGQGRANALRSIATSLANTDPEQAYEFALSQSETGRDAQVFASILSQWARTDPARAFDVAIKDLDPGQARNSAIQSIIAEVAGRDVDLALEMVQKLEPEVMNSAVYSFSHSLARADVGKALAWAEAMPDGETKERALTNVFSTWAEDDPEKACAQGLAFEDKEIRRSSLQSALNRWGYNDAVSAMTWAVENLSPAEQESLIPGSLLNTWASQDIKSASEWAAALSEGTLRTQSVSNITSTWARHDLVAAGEWLKKLKNGKSRDSAVERYASEVFETDPEASLIWAESIGDNKNRQEKMEDLARRYLRSNPAKAKRWIANSSLPQERKEELLKSAEGN
jgi:hypothetical protein